ncbi:MAG: RtcB family protein [Flavobacteriales bacterium]|nr:RtcB family protein [Flavobacteriales bacterium]
MASSKLRGKDLRKINYPNDKTKSMAIDIVQRHFKHLPKQEKLKLLTNVLLHPEDYLDHPEMGVLANEFVVKEEEKEGTFHDLDEAKPYQVYGRKFIDQNTIRQMDLAMKLPIAVQGALMPDAHVGYGLPVGGVLATQGAVIPYAVGLDIGCRMSLTIYDVPATFIERNRHQCKVAIKEHTHFGIGKIRENLEEHEVLDHADFQATEVLRQLHAKACNQIGTSGSGNHFVEIGKVCLEEDNRFGLRAGAYVGILAHSGSRGLGAAIANYYTRVAIDTCWLPKGAQHLAWLDLDSEAGQEYWLSMNLAGQYAKACHDVIHRKLAKALGIKPIHKVENHHNFAWKEMQVNGEEWIVHRKGATPAQEGVMGIIPATMVDPGYIVSGLGKAEALQSASHGSGRKMSRKRARESFTGSDMKKILKHSGVTLIGGGVDEAPLAYKPIQDVMDSQKELVKVEGTFLPKIVRMDK